jgi:uncharacterized membrane protein
MTLDTLLLALMACGLVIWVGGAITGQIWMFYAGQRGDFALRAALIPYINWIIRYIYIPLAATAFICGLVLAWRNGIPFTTPWILFPIIVFVATVITGSFYSLPEYSRLVHLLRTGDGRDQMLQRRITIAAWVNRIELLLVLIGLVGVIIQLSTR